jgi:hypothetical protein
VVRDQPDPVRDQRARIALVVKIALRVGYSAFLVAIVAFAIGLASDFPDWAVAVSIVGLAAAIVILPIPIVLGYGVRAAERDERQGPTHHR